MKNKELIEKIQKKVKGNGLTLKKTMTINVGDNDTQVMTEIINDEGEWCLSSPTWVVPLTELTNKELIYLKKCI